MQYKHQGVIMGRPYFFLPAVGLFVCLLLRAIKAIDIYHHSFSEIKLLYP